MKVLLKLATLAILTLACNANSKQSDETESQTNAVIEFENKEHDFGDLVEGDVVVHAFKFKNVGTDPLQILDVQVSCGCTVAAKPESLVGVGQESEIKIQFNSQGKVGSNAKSVGVISNAKNNQEVLTFTANVKAKTETETN